VTLATNVQTLTPSTPTGLIVTAVVTDAQGIGQVIGGTLTDPGGASYGAFQVSTTSGSYSLTLSWAAIDTVSLVNAPAGGAMRTFVATFYDQAGGSTSKSFSVLLTCANTAQPVCSGTCIDVQSDELNCGMCGRSCAATFGGSVLSCTAGKCSLYETAKTRESCGALCSGLGLTCFGSGTAVYAQGNAGTTSTLDCVTVPPATSVSIPFLNIDCDCSE
jgi:hypothetical protein